jgi:hypothetical protein
MLYRIPYDLKWIIDEFPKDEEYCNYDIPETGCPSFIPAHTINIVRDSIDPTIIIVAINCPDDDELTVAYKFKDGFLIELNDPSRMKT